MGYRIAAAAILSNGNTVPAGSRSFMDKAPCMEWLARISRDGFQVPDTDRYIPGHSVREFTYEIEETE